MTRRQRLKRDPANQRVHKLVAWVRKHPERVEQTIKLKGLIHPPRLTYTYKVEQRRRSRYFERFTEVQP